MHPKWTVHVISCSEVVALSPPAYKNTLKHFLCRWYFIFYSNIDVPFICRYILSLHKGSPQQTLMAEGLLSARPAPFSWYIPCVHLPPSHSGEGWKESPHRSVGSWCRIWEEPMPYLLPGQLVNTATWVIIVHSPYSWLGGPRKPLRMGKVFSQLTPGCLWSCIWHISPQKDYCDCYRVLLQTPPYHLSKTETLLNSQNIWLQGFGVREYRPVLLTHFIDAWSRV